jgi:hypothetical protein
MPIRQRGKHWQVDVRITDGTRIRRTFDSEESAKLAEEALRPTPQQRAVLKTASQRHSARKKGPPSGTTKPSASPSSPQQEASRLINSDHTTHQPLQPASNAPIQFPGGPASAPSAPGSARSARRAQPSAYPKFPDRNRESGS